MTHAQPRLYIGHYAARPPPPSPAVVRPPAPPTPRRCVIIVPFRDLHAAERASHTRFSPPPEATTRKY